MAAITPAERERSLARYAARMAEREAASARYEQWRRQEVRQAAGAQWLAELAEQRESELAAAAAEAVMGRLLGEAIEVRGEGEGARLSDLRLGLIDRLLRPRAPLRARLDRR